jgi:AraC-like DNA-binding protein
VIYLLQTDVISLLRHLVAALQPFAQAQGVQLEWVGASAPVSINFQPEFLIQDVTRVLCEVITFTPQEQAVRVSAQWEEEPVGELWIRIENTGCSLIDIQPNIGLLHYPMDCRELGTPGTLFSLRLSATREEVPSWNAAARLQPIKPFYWRLKEQLRGYFSDRSKASSGTVTLKIRDQVFLRKVQAVVEAHLGEEGFNAGALSQALAMSRAQLYRRLKPLIRYSPGQYIRLIRLQKARELLVSSGQTIGEIAYQAGFANQSHFTRAFRAQYGINPSELRKRRQRLPEDEALQPKSIANDTSGKE